LSRTPASAGNRKTWTWAGWVKKAGLSSYQTLFAAAAGDSNTTYFVLSLGRSSDDPLYVSLWDVNLLVTTQVFRDPSAWYHIAIAFDATQGTNANKLKLYVNGSEVTTFATDNRASISNQDYSVNSTTAHNIGANRGSNYLNGYLADIHFIDGQALDPTSFGEFDDNGIWQPIEYTGTYGTNGFHLDFADNASTTTIGYDAAGSNDWTANNLSVTAGAGNDSLVDVPTNGVQPDTGVGGEVRGNYATLNPLTSGFTGTLSNGNLDYNLGSGTKRVEGTIAVTAGKWWWEALAVSGTTNGTVGGRFGFCLQSSLNNPEAIAFGLHWHATSGIATVIGGSFTTRATGTNYGDGDVLGCALDADANIAYFYKNGALAYTYNFSSHLAVGSGNLTPHCWNASSGTPVWTYNFGQRAWTHTPRTSHKALNTANLPAPVVTKPSDLFDVKLWSGNGSSQTISGLAFDPDFVWVKRRSAAASNVLADVVRGITNSLYSNLTSQELATESDGYVQSVGTGSFSVTGGSNSANQVNASGSTYVGWTWDAGSSTVTNTVGSISSQVRANASAGFSIVTYTGTGSSGATIGHGLGVAPGFIIIKQRVAGPGSDLYNWNSYHSSLGATQYIALNMTDAVSTAPLFNNTAPTSSVFSLGSSSGGFNNVNNASGVTYVAYCFAPVEGYSAFGSYTGNGSADGPFVYTGFRPRFILFKNASATSGWNIFDTARDTYNAADKYLVANSSVVESSGTPVFDILSNGFKVRITWTDINGSGNSIIYFAVAESPFQYARAR
jgi:hypothetical protein